MAAPAQEEIIQTAESALGEHGQTLVEVGTIAVAVLLALFALEVVRWILVRIARRTSTQVDDTLVRELARPARLLVPTLAALFVSPSMELAGFAGEIRHAISLVLIAAVGWLLVAALEAGERIVLRRYDISASDNLMARSRHTQLRVLTRTVQIFIVVITIAVALMTFPRVRELGTSLLASAGIAGLVVGLAARPLLENIIAGLQIALTEPIRIDDVLIVEGEWGRVEEITATYVVVRIWDQRRLIVPLSYFLTKPFQNWTRESSELLGTAFLYLDYRAPIDAIRSKLEELCKSSEHWDGRVCKVQVTDARERVIEVRLLVSAPDSSAQWDLRCEVRQGVLEFLQENHPESLPRTRVAWEDGTVKVAGLDAGAQPDSGS
ncbi:MAG: mechanosensitive ion channel family protein [Phycisphaerales bacterium]